MYGNRVSPRFRLDAERGEVLAATARAVSTLGYEETTLEDIAALSGRPREEIRAEFGGKEGCVVAVYATTFHQAFVLARERAEAAVTWQEGIRDSIASFLELLANERDVVRCNLFGVRAMGVDGRLRLTAAIEAFSAFLAPGFEQPGSPPVMISEVLGSTIFHVIAKHVDEDRIEHIEQALPVILDAVLAPFCDRSEIAALLAEA